MIILTPEEANQVRGVTTPGHALAPRPLKNGKFALPESVLTDPAHAKHHNFLKTLPKVHDDSIKAGTPSDPRNPASPVIGSDWEQDPEKNRLATYQSNWVPGEAVGVDLVNMISTVPPIDVEVSSEEPPQESPPAA